MFSFCLVAQQGVSLVWVQGQLKNPPRQAGFEASVIHTLLSFTQHREDSLPEGEVRLTYCGQQIARFTQHREDSLPEGQIDSVKGSPVVE